MNVSSDGKRSSPTRVKASELACKANRGTLQAVAGGMPEEVIIVSGWKDTNATLDAMEGGCCRRDD